MVTTVVTTMLNQTRATFVSVTIFGALAVSAPILNILGWLPLPGSGVIDSVPYYHLVHAAFAIPQIVGILVVLAVYMSLHMLGYSKGIAPTFFIFIKPFYSSRHLEVRIEKTHLDLGKKSSQMESPVCLALSDLATHHGYHPLYVIQQGSSFRMVTKDATMFIAASPRLTKYLDDYNRFRPAQPTVVTLRVESVKLDKKEAGWLGFGLLRALG